jgi:predicted metal-dependent hydrolase
MPDLAAAAPAEPVLTPEEQAAFARGVAEFNDGLFFECHDTLEEMWSGVRGPSRDFFQGLIQVSVGFYHLGNANLGGAASMWTRALKRLSRYPDRYFGFDLQAHRAEIAYWLERARTGAVDGITLGDLPKWPPRTEAP